MYNFGVVMTEEEKKLLSTFEARLRHLIYLHDELKRENAELRNFSKQRRNKTKRYWLSTKTGNKLHKPKNSNDNQP